MDTVPSVGDELPDDLVEQLNAARGALNERMGVTITSASRAEVVATMPVQGNTQPYGLLHGGASVVLAESVGSVCAALHAGTGRVAVGLDINATHHRSLRSGTVTATCTPLRVGRSVGSFEVVVRDADGQRVCTSRLTCSLRDAVPSSG